MAQQVKFITFRGEKLPLRISYYAITRFQEETKVNIPQIDEDVKYLEVLLWYSLVAGHNAEKKELKITKDDVAFILDESIEEFNEVMMSFFPQAKEGAATDKKK